MRKEKEVEREGKRVEAGLARKRGLEVQDLEFRVSWCFLLFATGVSSLFPVAKDLSSRGLVYVLLRPRY